jgi:hypothetical protein
VTFVDFSGSGSQRFGRFARRPGRKRFEPCQPGRFGPAIRRLAILGLNADALFRPLTHKASVLNCPQKEPSSRQNGRSSAAEQ